MSPHHRLSPDAVYITTDADQDPLSRRRIDAMLSTFDAGGVHVVTERELNDVVEERGWKASRNWGTIPEEELRDPDVVFAVSKFPEEAERAERAAAYPSLGFRDMLAHQTLIYRVDGEDAWRERTHGIVCQPAWQLHTIMGCPFRCAYCGLGGAIRIITNMEEYCERLTEWVKIAPEQRLYKWDNQSDVIFFEPEYDATRLLVDFFSRQPDRYLEIYAGKSDNVDFMLDYDHRRHTILQWSLSAQTQSTLIEPKTADMTARIEAAHRCQEAGYIVRYRFSPIVPVRNWREENRALIERIFERTRPDVVSLCSFGWMDVETARQCIDFELLDPEFVAAMEAAAPFIKERGYTIGGARPIPHEPRYTMLKFLIDEIRRINPDQVIALCLETEEMWQALGPLVGQTSRNYVCNCGALCTPGWAKYDRMVATP